MLDLNSPNLDTIAENNTDLLFIDTNIDNYQSLLVRLNTTNIILLDSTRNGIEQITETLINYDEVDSIQIVSHGQAGSLQLGSTQLNASNLASYSADLAMWSESLSENGDILLLGCNVGAGTIGENFVTSLSQLTNADIAASDDLTGNSNLEGDWDLEFATGEIEADLAIDAVTRNNYDSVLETILDFNDFADTSQLTFNGNATLADNALNLTSAAKKQQGSIFYDQPLAVDADTSFETQFQFQLAGGSDGADGFTFMLQNDPQGLASLGDSGGGLGYRGITQSLAIEFDTFKNAGDIDNNHLAIVRDGNVNGAITSVAAPFDLNSGSTLNAWVNYDGATDLLEVFLAETTVKPETAALSENIDLTAVVGEQAYLGFGAGTGGRVNKHKINSWEFSALSTDPGMIGAESSINFDNFTNTDELTLNGNATQAGEALRLTSAGRKQHGSAFLERPLAVDADTSFTTQFEFKLSGGSGGADGFTFMLQNDLQGLNALGGVGGNLGYRGITQSLAIEFDTYHNAGDISFNHISVLQDGNVKDALTTVPAPFDLNSGNALNAWIEYDGESDLLEVFLADTTVKPETASLSQNIDLAAVVGSQAYLGFSAGTGGLSNNHDINNWKINNKASNPGVIGLETSIYDVNELDGSVDVTLLRTNGSDGIVTIDYDTVDASATAGEDYSTASGTLIFADGETSKTVTIPILDDNLAEGSEDFSFTIDNIVGDATLLVPRTALIKIVDDETGLEPIIDFDNFSDISKLKFNGDTSQAGNSLRLTPAARKQRGSAFFERPVAVDGDTSFETQFEFQLSGAGAGSDGFTFMLQNSLQGLNALGGTGGGLGYRDITKSLAIEFDTFKNGTDINNNHIAVLRDGDLNNALATTPVPFDLNGGDALNAWIDYDGESELLEVFLADGGVKPETASLSLDINLTSIVGDQAFVGFSAATGGLFNNHDLNNWEFTTESTLLSAPAASADVISETILSGLTLPTSIEWTPDGNTLFVSEKGGVIKVSQNGELLDMPFIDLSAQVNGTRDRGLIDIAVHPDFFNGSPYVYAAYTYDPPEVFQNSGLAGPDGKGNRTARVTRITADSSTNFTTAIPGSEVVILGTNGTWENFNAFANSTNDKNEPAAGILADGSNLEDFLAGDSESHTVGSVEFGPDGALYITNGDGASYNQVDPRIFRVQDIDNLSGKVLRIDPITGDGLADNPFFNGDANANRSKVYQLGLRNPFRMTVHPESGQVYVGEVGWSRWEEINAAAPGANFGWPYYEGGSGTNSPTRDYQDLPESQAFYASGEVTTSSLFALNHSVDGINAIVLGDIYTGNAFPEEYQGDLFINDLGQGIVRNLSFDESGNVSSVDTFTTGANVVVQIQEAPDGSLYYVDLDDGTVGNWSFS